MFVSLLQQEHVSFFSEMGTIITRGEISEKCDNRVKPGMSLF